MILLTGGTGFLGSYLLYYLLGRYPAVRALRRQGSTTAQTEFIFRRLYLADPIPGISGPAELLSRVQWIEGDIMDADSLEQAMEGIDIVYHAAASVSFSRKQARHTIINNVEGTAQVVNAALNAGVGKLAYVSSVAALGRRHGETIDETAQVEDNKFSNAYSESKYRSEMEVWRGVAEGLPAVIINPGVILGWGDFRRGSCEIFRTVYEGLKVYPSGGNAFVDARDVAQCLIELAERDDTYNKRYICTAENLPFKQLLSMIAGAFGKKPPGIAATLRMTQAVWLMAELKSLFTGKDPFITKDVAASSNRMYRYDNSRIRNTLDWQFRPLEQTVQETADAFREWAKGNMVSAHK